MEQDDMTLDIRQADFWKLDTVDTELRRIYGICAGCRRCLPLCPSFKVMFERLDSDAVDGDVEMLPAADVQEARSRPTSCASRGPMCRRWSGARPWTGRGVSRKSTSSCR
jgi:ferredoxin